MPNADHEMQSDHAIDIGDRKDAPSYIFTSMRQKMEQAPRLPSKEAGETSHCIFKTPKSLTEFDRKAYEPQIVSIGPYHHGENHLTTFEKEKWRILRSLVSRTQEKNGFRLDAYVKAIIPLEASARKCYSDEASLPDKNEFVEMLILDGCFIVELLRAARELITVERDDPIFTTPWIFPLLLSDLLKLENQLPFFILERLFDISKSSEGAEEDSSLESLALNFFNSAMQMRGNVSKYRDLDTKHLLDLFRFAFLPEGKEERTEPNFSRQLIPCATKLRVAGIRFLPVKADSFLDIRFQNGYLQVPPLTIDDLTASLILNCVAFEQCYMHHSMHFTAYSAFINCLIHTTKDVGLLTDANVFNNYLPKDEDVVRFFNELGKNSVLDVTEGYLLKESEQVHEYYEKKYYLGTFSTSFKDKYLDSLWTFIGLIAAFIVLALTILQTFYTILIYYNP